MSDRSEYKKQWYLNNQNRLLKKRHLYVVGHAEEISSYNKNYYQEVVKKEPQKRKDYSKASRQKLKKEAIQRLGGFCRCCRSDVMDFLTIDHVNGDGGQHRKELKMDGKNSRTIYKEIRDHGDPESRYQVLCWNCNMSKHFGGGVCFHERT